MKSNSIVGALAALAMLAPSPSFGSGFTALVAFGDSYTDTGNAPSSPPDYWEGRFSNGPLWVEYLSRQLGFAYDASKNYAVSGSESDELGVAIAKFPGTTDSSAVLFAIWSGNNDFLGHLDIGINDTAWNDSVTHTVSSLTNSCDLLYQKGARNILLFNQFDITKLPYVQGSYSTTYCDYLLGKITTLNAKLDNALGPFLASHPGLQISVVDAYGDFNTLLANYQSYGFTDDTIGAINDPSLTNISFTGPGADYVFWDSQHPTTKTHALIAGWVATVLGATTTALTVDIDGEGSVSPNDNGKDLQIGQNYSMTATAAAGFAFGAWSDDADTVLTTSRQLNFTMKSNLTLIATFADVTPPSVAMSRPVQEVATPGLLVQGTARDNVGVANVFCQLNDGSWNPVSSANGFTNWTTNLMLAGGANMIRSYSMDLAGNFSKTSSVSVFYVTTTPLTLGINGWGNIARGFTGNLLIVGKPYTVRGVPNVNNLFSNWSGVVPGGSFTLAGNPVTFLMQSNMVLTANFVTNQFLQATGEYNGLFSVTASGVAQETAGLLQHLMVSPLGAYSGQLSLGGQNYSVSGGFNVAGLASLTIAQIDHRGPLLLEMALNWNTVPCQLTGSVSGTNGGSWTADLMAELASHNPQSGEYTMLLPPPAEEPGSSPSGCGYAAIADHDGMVTLSGALADGTHFNQTVAVAETGDLPVYANLYSRAGLLLGWINLANGSPAGDLVWIRPSSATSPPYPNGFTNHVQALWSPWTNPPPGVAAVVMTNGQLNISGADQLPPQLSFNVQVNTRNALIKITGTSPPNSLTGSINPKNGVLTVNFGNDTGRATTVGLGAVLQNTSTAGGFFVGKTNAGSMTLAPGSP